MTTGCWRLTFRTTTWARCSRPGPSFRKRSSTGKKQPGEALRAWFVTATDPDHKYEGYVRRIASKAEMVEQKHVDKVTVGFDEAVRHEFLSKNQDLRPVLR